MKSRKSEPKDILTENLVVINIGLEVFKDSLSDQNTEVISVRWRPPHKPPEDLEDILDQLL